MNDKPGSEPHFASISVAPFLQGHREPIGQRPHGPAQGKSAVMGIVHCADSDGAQQCSANYRCETKRILWMEMPKRIGENMEKLRLLVVEDNRDDFELFSFALRKSKVLCSASHAETSQDAIAYLDGWGKYSDRAEFPVPDIAILDLKLVGMDGFQVLKWIRDHPVYRLLPVVILTSSSLEEDVQHAFDLGANSYFVKPAALSDMNVLIDVLLNYCAR